MKRITIALGLVVALAATAGAQQMDHSQHGKAAAPCPLHLKTLELTPVQQTIVDSIRAMANPRRLRRTHQAVAEALVTRAPNAAAAIALHYDQAGDAPRAFQWAMRAGRQATGVHAHDDVVLGGVRVGQIRQGESAGTGFPVVDGDGFHGRSSVAEQQRSRSGMPAWAGAARAAS